MLASDDTRAVDRASAVPAPDVADAVGPTEVTHEPPGQLIDLRSDTVTRPGEAMRRAMAEAEVGDDVFGDDPTVDALQERIAALLGFEAALFVSSGTQSNLCALLAHCGRGDEYIAGQSAHTYRWEGGGAAVLGGIQPQPLPHRSDGTLDPADIAAAVKPDDPHFARTRLLCLENTIEGRAVSLDYLRTATGVARDHGLATHLDGARLFNAAVAGGRDPYEQARLITEHFDSVSVCFSKGLGAPVGSALVGSRDFVARARRWRKVLGGGMRQAGVLAAAALHALDHHVARLVDDHAHAALFAEGLKDVPGLTVEPARTNMVFAEPAPGFDTDEVRDRLARRGLLCAGYPGRLRFVFHLDVSRADTERAVRVVRETFEQAAPR
ncbi:low-specificity L-threonine aldolase [Streptomyces chromofuscus]|uniref:Low-specificity L-threonine aldolase n=1 Tax=Streptomyces chromofuscus TaxID=42881 RepID=A0A7M2T854_STRCW|nr:low-specificity L-threonine aldolase [Streptomyces chromofuscus]QOV44083.1 low-specificity L-threonine aldolase [Streptomyces chromofuscus]